LIKPNKPRNWNRYYKETVNSPPTPTLGLALWLFEAETLRQKKRFAIDLGCGAGRDTTELLRRGWTVLAIDKQPQAIRLTNTAAATRYQRNLRTSLASFEEMTLPRCDLLNASWCLPFCSPQNFNSLWKKITTSIRPRGRFSGHLFGTHDGWINDTEMTFHSTPEVKRRFQGFQTELLLEKEWDGKTASGKRKHWHVYAIVAKKP
jgi:SAM-dependent methyltransferase